MSQLARKILAASKIFCRGGNKHQILHLPVRQFGFVPYGQKPDYTVPVFPKNINEYAKNIDTSMTPEEREHVNKLKKMIKGPKAQRWKFNYTGCIHFSN